MGSTTFYLILCFTNPARKVVRITSDLVNLFNILFEYHKFIDIFNKVKVETLAFHLLYNLQIKLANEKKLSIWTTYSPSIAEQKVFKEFIWENLNMGFIWPTFSPYRIPVLFVKKKDSSLYLCIDFQELNHIIWKDKYPLSLISNLLDLSQKAYIYTKIDLQYAYYLVRVIEGNEWKTAF